MKVCKVCKKELPENATFCDGCGNKIIETSIKKQNKRHSMKVIVSIAIVVTVCIVAIIGVLISKDKILYNHYRIKGDKEESISKSIDYYVDALEIKYTDETVRDISDRIKEIKSLNEEDCYTSEFKKNSLYYKSLYICPSCNSHMLYKIRAYNIDTEFKNKNKRIHHIYTCPNCKIFLASIRIYSKIHSRWIGNKLSNYALISGSYPRLKYKKILNYTEGLHSD